MQFICALMAGIAAFLQPIRVMCIMVVVFIAIDFVIGVWASHRRAIQHGTKWYFQSRRAWRTIEKLCFALVAIVMSFSLDVHIFGDTALYLTKGVTGLVCGWEFWSYMENAGDLSEAKFFKLLGRFAKKEIEKHTDIEIGELKENEDNTK